MARKSFIVPVFSMLMVIILLGGEKAASAQYSPESVSLTWHQIVSNGFGDSNNEQLMRLSVHSGFLFGSTKNLMTGAEVWRTQNGVDWNQVNTDGFGSISNTHAFVEGTFGNYLYVGTQNDALGAELWRCALCDGSDWSKVASGGFNDVNNHIIQRVIVFNNILFATVDNGVTGMEVWKSSTGNPNTWTQTNTDGFGNPLNNGAWAVAVYRGYLYIAPCQMDGTSWTLGGFLGTEVWRTNNGVAWNKVTPTDFTGNSNAGWDLSVAKNQLYLSTGNESGAEIRRCTVCDGSDWETIVSGDFGSRAFAATVMEYKDGLYAGTTNNWFLDDTLGMDVWYSPDGSNSSWTKVAGDGFGNPDNKGASAKTLAEFNGQIYIGTWNYATGMEIWGTMVTRGKWIPTGSMKTARQDHVAIPLSNGKVLIVGGTDNNDHCLASAELYDPATGLWTPTGSLNTARAYFSATRIANGKVLVAGGYDGSLIQDSAELYDPVTGLWTTTGSLNYARDYHSAVLLSSGKVLVAGGNNYGSISTAELYDPATGLWSPTGSMNVGRMEWTAQFLSNGKVLMASGGTFDDLNSAELYNPSTGLWSLTDSRVFPHAHPTVMLLDNDKVLVAGGYNPYGASFSSAELYQPDTGLWTATGSMKTGRWRHSAVLLPGGFAMVTGGIDGLGSALSSAELYEPETGLWYLTEAMNNIRTYHTTTLLPNGQVLAAGGWYGGALSSAELYITEFVISGNTGVGGVTLQYTDGISKAVTSSGNGNYSITVPYGWSGTVTPSKANYTFTPENSTYTNVTSDWTEQNYSASPISQPQFKLYLPMILKP